MPIKPAPIQVRCPCCNWKKVFIPQSDVIMRPDWFRQCPECGSKKLIHEQSTKIQSLMAHVLNLVNRHQ